MAKKKKAGKPPKPPKRPTKPPVKAKAPKSVGARKKPGAKRSPARQPSLPGTEQVRRRILDLCCEDIGIARDTMNTARLDEQGAIQRAMKYMLSTPEPNRVHKYRHAGVELALVEGVDKLRVRVTKDAENIASTGDGAEKVPESPSDGPDADEGADEGIDNEGDEA